MIIKELFRFFIFHGEGQQHQEDMGFQKESLLQCEVS